MVQIKSHKDLVHFETAYVVKLHFVARLANTQPVSFFAWMHMDVCSVVIYSPKLDLVVHIFICSNSYSPSPIQNTQIIHAISGTKSFSLIFRRTLVQPWSMACASSFSFFFELGILGIYRLTLSHMLFFVQYATLYKNVHLGIEPSTATPNMFIWYGNWWMLTKLVLCKSMLVYSLTCNDSIRMQTLKAIFLFFPRNWNGNKLCRKERICLYHWATLNLFYIWAWKLELIMIKSFTRA